ncbi:hypothetical protein CLAFUW4_02537 [Fulvia fulva]|uniref:Uncharacterized protein n=1 Tax=Passalora fulva TaxID=5499 RepID=A0A9Q8LB93_PASFU|nr:uncharacterized protein CLAFUR5_02527 [Fulvia fulva]KAK4632416.1 hypothetical protein CLAFUR4_02532 [Fulvia fulva]KAK4633401.1 hypothetical protein CLAFUR0_02536 [Fulvia fulva]UJO14079.1 hypothetical protein CLAFUR5_02527 [Fulvia fulva]WPV11921.1 hypothetical protein CLAFUW4_02537 [Fulvia fulva]WPV25882.1 hypothetical protein CLAFUW7_02537 [Fulvia fulva]
MAIRQHRAPAAKKAKPVKAIEPEVEDDSSEDLALDDGEEEFHSEDESEDADIAAIAEDEEEFHTASGDEGDDEDDHVPSAPLLPASLLKSKPTSTSVPVKISWNSLSRHQKKALRDEMGVSMKELRTQVQGTGVIEAGRAAQLKRGILPADKVAGSRIAKKRKRKGGQPKIESSGKQKLIEERKRRMLENARGSVLPVKKRKTKAHSRR